MKLTKTVKQIALLNVMIFIISYAMDYSFFDQFALFPNGSELYQPYQYLTHMFLHASPAHIIFNMLAFLSFGSDVEKFFGRNKFVLFYLLSGLGAAFLHIIVTGSQSSMVGASGAIFGVLLMAAILNPEQKFYLFFVLPIKAKIIVPLILVAELFIGIMYPGDHIAHFAHIGGALTGGLFYLMNKFIKKWKTDY